MGTKEQKEAQRFVSELAREKRRELDASPDLNRSIGLHIHAWADPSHAVLELLQNADDAGPAVDRNSVAIDFRLLADGLLVEHNGRPFSRDEVRALCSIGGTTKSADTDIGFLGIGFKSVYKLARAAYVRSGPYSFSFSPENYPGDGYSWILVPAWCDDPLKQLPRTESTRFYFPYGEDGDQIRAQLETALLRELPALVGLFLRHVSLIRVFIGDECRRAIESQNGAVHEVIEGRESQRRFRVFQRTFKVPMQCRRQARVRESGRAQARTREVTLVFETGVKGDLEPINEASSVFAFLPTQHATPLPFVVHADFILDSQRSFLDRSLR